MRIENSILKNVFKNHSLMLDQELGVMLKRDFQEYMQALQPDEREAVWDKIIHGCEVGDLRTALHLDYIFQTVGKRYISSRKIAVVAHMNYTDLIERCFGYIAEIPEYIDVYITTKGSKNIGLIQNKIDSLSGNNVKIVVPENRGREISGLLVACKDILMKYDYLCFVHDKKSNKGEVYQTVGQSFCDILWENSIKNAIYIENIIKKFEEEPRLGLLAPPAPYFSKLFIVGFLGWCNSYDKTIQLAERLNLNCIIDRNKQPFVLGTTFWCKTKALRPLFEAGFDYEDFEPEPMPTDNTISHAIERILPYVAQSEGYYSGIMMTAEYASLYTCNYQYMIDTIVDKIVYRDIFKKQYRNYSEILDKNQKIYIFAKKFSSIYIYGAGVSGQKCLDILENGYKQKIKGFLVSDGHKKNEEVKGIPVIEISQICPKEEDGIIVALNLENMLEVLQELKSRGFSNIERFS